MKKIMIGLFLAVLLVFLGSNGGVPPVFATNDWLVKEKQPNKDGSQWVLYEDGSTQKINGNVPEMQLPYGHDKDSGREKADRGRPIRDNPKSESEPTLTVSINFTEHRLLYAQQRVAIALTGKYDYYNADYWKWYVEQLTNKPTQYKTGEPMRRNGVDSIGYTITIPYGYKKNTTFNVTATLTSVNDYYSRDSRYVDSVTNKETGLSTPIQYKAGDIINEQTHEIVVGNDNTLFSTYASTAPMREQVTGLRDGNTFFFAYTPPKSMLIGRDDIYAKLTITVTEPKSGYKYSVTYYWTLRIMV